MPRGTSVLEYGCDDRVEALNLARAVVGILHAGATLRDCGLYGVPSPITTVELIAGVDDESGVECDA